MVSGCFSLAAAIASPPEKQWLQGERVKRFFLLSLQPAGAAFLGANQARAHTAVSFFAELCLVTPRVVWRASGRALFI